jgi:putative transposase
MDWPHAPLHRFGEGGTYFITASTYLKQHIFTTRRALDALMKTLFAQARLHDCWLEAWAIFSNHYHLVVQSDVGESIRAMVKQLHKESALEANQRDEAMGRTVWYQSRDTQLTIQASWLARLRYTHENAVHHGLVRDATQYHWCSAAWFERTARPAFVQTVRRMKIDRVNVYDDFVVRESAN